MQEVNLKFLFNYSSDDCSDEIATNLLKSWFKVIAKFNMIVNSNVQGIKITTLMITNFPIFIKDRLQLLEITVNRFKMIVLMTDQYHHFKLMLKKRINSSVVEGVRLFVWIVGGDISFLVLSPFREKAALVLQLINQV